MSLQDVDLVRNYVSKIQDLEAELLRLQNFSSSGRNDFMDVLDLVDDDLSSKDAIRDFSCTADGKSADLPGERLEKFAVFAICLFSLIFHMLFIYYFIFCKCYLMSCTGDIESDEKELEHSTMQERFDKELKELESQLEQKEVVGFILLIRHKSVHN